MPEFQPVKIVALDTHLTRQSESAPGMRHMYLRLSASVPVEWGYLLDSQRQFPRHSGWRRAWASGQHIIVDCVPEELEKHHLADLKEDVAVVNREYKEFLDKKAAEKKRLAGEQAAEKEYLEEIKGRLNFD